MISACPSRPRWREWLDNRVSAEERTEMALHLEGCQHCQRLLDDLGGADKGWADAANAGTVSPPDKECIRAMNELKDRPPMFQAPAADPLSSNDPAVLKQIDGYEILGEIGRGGMGVVLKGFDPKLRRVVAIKVLAPHLAANAAARERFLREARAAAAVAHEHVVTIHSVEESPSGTPYLVMQFVPGRSLQERLDQSGPLELKEILRIGMQTAEGLAAAHRQGLVHRDIKPANILLENGVERVKLADFGLARAADDASLTRSGVITGSPQFMSPEQARGETADHRSDLFGLGCVMYAMCAGHPPFRASSPLAVLRRVCDDAPRPLREINPDIPDWLEAIVFKLLAKEPAERFGSAAEVADLLGQHLRHMQQPDAAEPAMVKIPASALARRDSVVAARANRAAPKGSDRAIWIILLCVAGVFLFCAGCPVFALLFFWGSADSGAPAGPRAPMVQSAPPVVRTASDSAVRVTKPARGVIETLTDPKADEFERMRHYCTIESVTYDQKTRTVSWAATTRSSYRLEVEAQVNLENACYPIRFFDKGGKEVGRVSLAGKLGKRAVDGRYQVFLELRLSDEIVNKAASLEVSAK